MKNHFLTLFIGIVFFMSNKTLSQITTIDYATYSSNECNVFGPATAISGIIHSSVAGQPTFNNSNQSVHLDYNYNNGSQTGTRFKIQYSLVKDYSYKVVVTARNTSNASYSVAAELKINHGTSLLGGSCSGLESINGVGNSFAIINTAIFGNNFKDYEYDISALSSNSNDFTFSTFTNNGVPSPSIKL